MHADQPARIEDVLQHHAWIRSVARALLGADCDVDDVVQETLLTAMQQLPRSRARLRSWLRRVTANHARQLWRRKGIEIRALAASDAAGTVASAAADTVASAAADTAADTAAIVEHVEMEVLVGRLVVELPTQARRIVLLRYYDDLSCAEIARRDGESAGAVRTRLRRAILLLRARLIVETGGSKDDLAVLLLPVAGLLPRGATAPVRRPARWAWRGTAALLLVALGLLAARPFLVGSAPAGAITARRAPGVATTTARAHSGRGVLGEQGTAHRGEATPPVLRRGAAPGTPRQFVTSDPRRILRVRGQLPPTAGPATGSWHVAVRVIDVGTLPRDAEVLEFEVAQAEFSRELVLERPVEDLCELWVEAQHALFLPVRWTVPVPPGAPRNIALGAPPGAERAARITGTFVDEDGAAVAGASVAVLEIPPIGNAATRSESTYSGAQGRFALRATPRTDILVVAWTSDSAVTSRRLTVGAAGSSRDLTLSRRRGVRVAGHVRGPSGFPWEDVDVTLWSERGDVTAAAGGRKFWVRGDAAWGAGDFTTLLADGSFRFPLSTDRGGTLFLSGSGIDGALLGRHPIEAQREGEQWQLDVEGVPMEVSVSGEGQALGDAWGLLEGDGDGVVVPFDPAGTARIWVAPGARRTLTVSRTGFVAQSKEFDVGLNGSPPPLTFELLPLPPARTWWIEVLPGQGPLPQTLGVALFDSDGRSPLPRRILVGKRAGRRYRIDGVPRGEFSASLRLGCEWSVGRSVFADVDASLDAREGDPRTARVVFRPGGRLILGARDESGQFVRALCQILRSDGSRVRAGFIGGRLGQVRSALVDLGDAGLAQLDQALLPGSYTLRAEYPGYAAAETTVHVAEGSLETVVLQLRRP